MSEARVMASRTPVPDPTTLTTKQLRRELLLLKRYLESRFMLVDEKIAGVYRQLKSDREAALAHDAVTSNSIAKTESSLSKQIDGQQQWTQTNINGLTQRYDDLKSRLDRGEGSDVGSKETRVEKRADMASLAGVAGLVIAVLVGLAQIVSMFSHLKP